MSLWKLAANVTLALLIASCAHSHTDAPKPSAEHAAPLPKRKPRISAHRYPRRVSVWTTELTLGELREIAKGYVPRVDRGNLVAIDSQRADWDEYVRRVHKKLHFEFAHGFLGTLPSFGPLGNPNLVTTVELAVRGDGSPAHVGIVRSSGDEFYDLGVMAVVLQSAPYARPPASIQSPDSLTYLHWALHRNESQCGIWNAEPFILRSAPQVTPTAAN